MESSTSPEREPPSLARIAGTKTRGAIAAQACGTCRARKQKCDEQRPRCSSCQRLGVKCVYREPIPTKKEKTLVDILDRLKSIEGRVGRMSTRALTLSRPEDFETQSATDSGGDSQEHGESPRTLLTMQPDKLGSGTTHSNEHTSAAHKMLIWPVMQQLLSKASPVQIMADLDSLQQQGSVFLVRLLEDVPVLPSGEALSMRPFVGMQSAESRASGAARVVFTGLTRESMTELATAYFDTFNLLYPFMDRQGFFSDTLTKMLSEGFDSDSQSVIALLVFALGTLALESTHGQPIDIQGNRRSGLKGGSSAKPPGLAFFNEARRHIGFVLAEGSLENVQMFCLFVLRVLFPPYSQYTLLRVLWAVAFIYLKEFWRFTESASLACKFMVTHHSIDWDSPRGDLVKRIYWHCVIMETGLYLELDLPSTGLIELERQVGVPEFNSAFCLMDHQANQFSHFEAHYASQIALRRLCAYVHDTIKEANVFRAGITGSPSTSSLKELSEQVSRWRSMLPNDLQWNEGQPAEFPVAPPANLLGQTYDSPLRSYASNAQEALFTADSSSENLGCPFVYDIQVALLRSRYYYAKHMVTRPFIYKVLHFPDQLTSEDVEGAAESLQYLLKWPLLFSPACHRKRLIPYLFCWSQNFLGILLILHLARHNPALREVAMRYCGPHFEANADQTVELAIDWIRDMKSADRIAAWCWRILQAVYDVI